jgi:hypothetical protein
MASSTATSRSSGLRIQSKLPMHSPPDSRVSLEQKENIESMANGMGRRERRVVATLTCLTRGFSISSIQGHRALQPRLSSEPRAAITILSEI